MTLQELIEQAVRTGEDPLCAISRGLADLPLVT